MEIGSIFTETKRINRGSGRCRAKPVHWRNYCRFVSCCHADPTAKLACCGHTMRKQGSCLEKVIMHGTMPGARKRGRPRTAWMDNIKTWTGLPVEESVRMTTEDRDKWRVRPWCGQPWYRGRIKNRTEQTQRRRGCAISSCAVPVGPSFPHTPSQRPSVANKNTRYSVVE